MVAVATVVATDACMHMQVFQDDVHGPTVNIPLNWHNYQPQ
jgi:hypothetical protein